MANKSIPYASATSGDNARKEIIKMLRRFGCEEIGISDNFEKHEILLYFVHRGRQVQRTISAKGWAAWYLREHPWRLNHRTPRVEYEQRWLKQGHIAINSVLRDWIKSQVTNWECDIHAFEAAFLPYMLTADGRPLVERLAETNLLPPPDEPKVIPLPGAA